MMHETLSQQKGRAQIIHFDSDLPTKKQLDVIAEDIVELTLESKTTQVTYQSWILYQETISTEKRYPQSIISWKCKQRKEPVP